MKSMRRSGLVRWMSAALLSAAMLGGCADVGYEDEEEMDGEDSTESSSAALETTAAVATKNKTVYSGSGGTKVLAYYQKRGAKFYAIGIHVTDVKCDDMGAKGYIYNGGLAGASTWPNNQGCRTDSWWKTADIEATGICACDSNWNGCRNLKCVKFD